MKNIGWENLCDFDRLFSPEVPAQLVLAAVFKTVGPYEKHAVGGFDSHALPLSSRGV